MLHRKIHQMLKEIVPPTNSLKMENSFTTSQKKSQEFKESEMKPE